MNCRRDSRYEGIDTAQELARVAAGMPIPEVKPKEKRERTVPALVSTTCLHCGSHSAKVPNGKPEPCDMCGKKSKSLVMKPQYWGKA